MNPKVVGAISGSMGGALLGALTGWLIDKGTGAGYGAILGGAASGFVGYAVAPTASTTPAPAGTGALPRRMAQINDQLMPRRVGAGAVLSARGQPVTPSISCWQERCYENPAKPGTTVCTSHYVC